MLDQLMPLHWGLVDRTLNVFNVKPVSRITKPVRGGGVEERIATSSQVKRVSGSGSTRRISGSGAVKIIGGGGRTCL